MRWRVGHQSEGVAAVIVGREQKHDVAPQQRVRDQQVARGGRLLRVVARHRRPPYLRVGEEGDCGGGAGLLVWAEAGAGAGKKRPRRTGGGDGDGPSTRSPSATPASSLRSSPKAASASAAGSYGGEATSASRIALLRALWTVGPSVPSEYSRAPAHTLEMASPATLAAMSVGAVGGGAGLGTQSALIMS